MFEKSQLKCFNAKILHFLTLAQETSIDFFNQSFEIRLSLKICQSSNEVEHKSITHSMFQIMNMLTLLML